ncbi:hypothetical protein [Actinokineospora enzanensis]|uniref:hypothetical protein n=1 Tax=Actinokineospora enzanensis TaxID=155975 RepID=UPI00037CC1EE|nr:hypothetical protein [Actinokineospora enzanensis]
MDERELIGMIGAELGGGFAVDVGALEGYCREAGARGKAVRDVGRGLAVVDGSGFGWVGRESGFADAVKEFAESLGRRVSGAAESVEELGKAVGRSAEGYRRADKGNADKFMGER